MKMFFDRKGGLNGEPLYLLLFGKGLYDNRKIGETGKYVKYPTLLTYQHGSGTDERQSWIRQTITSDSSTTIPGNRIASDKLRVNIGRLPYKKRKQEAKDVVSE